MDKNTEEMFAPHYPLLSAGCKACCSLPTLACCPISLSDLWLPHSLLETNNCIVVNTCVSLVHLPVDLGLEGNVGYLLVAQGLLLFIGWLLDEAGCVLVAQGLLMDLSCFILKAKNFRPRSLGFKLILDLMEMTVWTMIFDKSGHFAVW